MNNNIFSLITQSIETSSTFQPILFTSSSLLGLHISLYEEIEKVFAYFGENKLHIHVLKDDGDALKIQTIREFINRSHLRSSGKFQVFVIENISRFTLQSANAMLKFLEEPTQGSVVLLTNTSSSGVLETILSRVKLVEIAGNVEKKKSAFFEDMIVNFLQKNDMALFQYFFQEKQIEKSDYIDFFSTLIEQAQIYHWGEELLDEIHSSLELLHHSPVIPKFLVDRTLYILQNNFSIGNK